MVPTEIKSKLISAHQVYNSPSLLLERYRSFLQPHRRCGLLARNEGEAFTSRAELVLDRLSIKNEFPVLIAAFLDEQDYAPGGFYVAQRFFGGEPSVYQQPHKFWYFENRGLFFAHVERQFIAHGESWGELARRKLGLAPDAVLDFALHHFSLDDQGKWWRTLFSLVEQREMSEL